MRIMSIKYGEKCFDLDANLYVESVRKFSEAARHLGSLSHMKRANPEKGAERRLAFIRQNQLEIELATVVEELLVEAFRLGYDHAKLSDGKEFHCFHCKEGFDSLSDLFEHAHRSTDSECMKKLEAWARGEKV